MQIHLIKTPDYPLEDFLGVIDILHSFPGPVTFVSSQHVFVKEEFYFLTRGMELGRGAAGSLEKRMYIASQGMPLSWKELFGLCETYREVTHVNERHMVVLLTERANTLNWFSMFDGEGNAFVHTADWDLFTSSPAKYPVAYEVMANVLRELMNLEHSQPADWSHEHPIGCMNDLCMKKGDISLKLRTADICKACLRKIRDAGVSDLIIQQALRLFEGIRKQMLFSAGQHPQLNPVAVKLSLSRKLLFPELGHLSIRLNPLEMTLYTFYLLHSEGVRLNELSDHQSELLSIYNRYSVHDSLEDIKTRIRSLTDPFSNSFSEKKSSLNRKLKQALGKELSAFYTIQGDPGSAFKISLSRDLVEIEEMSVPPLMDTDCEIEMPSHEINWKFDNIDLVPKDDGYFPNRQACRDYPF